MGHIQINLISSQLINLPYLLCNYLIILISIEKFKI